MSAEPRLIPLATVDGGFDTVTIPAAIFEQANATLDIEAEQRRRQAEAASADALRLQNTRRARAARRFRKALAALRRLK